MPFKIYTKTGDDGKTSLFGGKRLPKHHIRIEAYGTIDELNACIGIVRDQIENEKDRKILLEIQHRLFTIGASLASDPEKKPPVPDLLDRDVRLLEREIDRMQAELPTLKNFILPGGAPAISFCHLARCVCRRAERATVALAEQEPVEDLILIYLNRLSDFLFVLARSIAQELRIEEIKWEKRQKT